MFSDGLTEALAPDGGALGVDGVKRWIERLADQPLAQRVEGIAAAARSLNLRDDLTLLCIAGEEPPGR